MEARELRIGNFVYDAIENIHQITSIDNVDLGLLGCSIELRFAKPIPLTEEWLLKFGFEDDFLGFGIIRIFESDFGYKIYKGHGCFDVNCFYVHQLQNLYFALTQKELVYEKTV